MAVPFTTILDGLRTSSPFPGVKALERRRGRPYRARLGSNECLFGVSPCALRAMVRHSNELPLYADPTHSDLRMALAAAWELSEEHIVVAEGIEGLLALLVRAVIEPDDTAATSLGSYASFDYYVKGCGGRLVHQPYRASAAVDLEGLLALARRNRAKLLYLANPDNPTGRHLTASEIATILERLHDNCVLLLDEAYVEFLPDEDVFPQTVVRSNLVRLRSFSKAYGLAGARIGYAVTDPAVVSPLERIRQHFAVSRLSEEMALAALNDHAFLKNVLAQTALGRAHYTSIAAHLGVSTIPSSTNFVTFDFDTASRSRTIAERLEQNDIFVQRPSEQPLDRLVRITIGPPEARAYLSEVLQSAMIEL